MERKAKRRRLPFKISVGLNGFDGRGICRSGDPDRERPMFTFLREEGKYKCFECDFQHPDCSKMVMHFLKMHTRKGIPKKFRCPMCPFYHIVMKEVQKHRRECKGRSEQEASLKKFGLNREVKYREPKPYRCLDCNGCFRREKYLHQHMKDCHVHRKVFRTNLKRYPCNVCAATFIKRSSLKVHLGRAHKLYGKHQEEPQKKVKIRRVQRCYACSYYALNPKSFKKHMAGHKLQYGICAVCKGVYESKTDLKKHTKDKHSEIFQGKCYLYGKHSSVEVSVDESNVDTNIDSNLKTNERELLKLWKQKNEERLIALKKVVDKMNTVALNYSQQDISFLITTGLRPLYSSDENKGIFKCSHCEEYQYRDLYDLRKHFKHHHLNLFDCTICLHICRSQESFKRHLQEKHQTDLPGSYICDVCGKRFNQITALTRHKTVHDNVQDYVCPMCDKKFNQSYSMKRHLLTHMKIKPFKCGVCDIVYSQLHPLKLHLKKKHPDVNVDENVIRVKNTSEVYEEICEGGPVDLPITNQKKRKRQQSTDFPTNKKHKSATTLDSNEPQKSSPTRHSDKAVQDRDTPGNGKHEKPRRYTAWTPYETEVVIYFFKSNIDLRKLPGKKELISFSEKYPNFPHDSRKVKTKVMNEIYKLKNAVKQT